MLRRNTELILALLTVLILGMGYIFVIYHQGSVPAASELFGHSLGIIGFTLMLMTETLYSIRKRSRSARWGKMSSWLQFHIYTGLVGPFLVLLHSSWKYNGIAGIVLLLTGLIVISGFIGRYIYTAIPRDIHGLEIEAKELNQNIREVEIKIESILSTRAETHHNLSIDLTTNSGTSASGFAAVLGRFFSELQDRFRFIKFARSLDYQTRQEFRELNKLLRERARLKRSVSSLAAARQIMALWHAVHIPIGLALFSLAAVHILAAIYYASLLQ